MIWNGLYQAGTVLFWTCFFKLPKIEKPASDPKAFRNACLSHEQ